MLEKDKYIEFQLNKISNGWVVRQVLENETKDTFFDSFKTVESNAVLVLTKYLYDIQDITKQEYEEGRDEAQNVGLLNAMSEKIENFSVLNVIDVVKYVCEIESKNNLEENIRLDEEEED